MPSQDRNIVVIPEPKGLPYLGNVGEFKSENTLKDLDRLHDKYGKYIMRCESVWLTLLLGEIFRLRFPDAKTTVFAGSNKLVNELCDESRFKKSIQGELIEAR